MSAQPQPYLTFDKYLARERQAETRSEYVNGQSVAMPASSPEHALIVSNLVAGIGLLLKERACFVFGSNMRLYIST